MQANQNRLLSGKLGMIFFSCPKGVSYWLSCEKVIGISANSIPRAAESGLWESRQAAART